MSSHEGDYGHDNVADSLNDIHTDSWKKWNKDATELLKELIKQGLSFEEIQDRMSEYTYIQIYQHYQQLTINRNPWEDRTKQDMD